MIKISSSYSYKGFLSHSQFYYFLLFTFHSESSQYNELVSNWPVRWIECLSVSQRTINLTMTFICNPSHPPFVRTDIPLRQTRLVVCLYCMCFPLYDWLLVNIGYTNAKALVFQCHMNSLLFIRLIFHADGKFLFHIWSDLYSSYGVIYSLL